MAEYLSDADELDDLRARLREVEAERDQWRRNAETCVGRRVVLAEKLREVEAERDHLRGALADNEQAWTTCNRKRTEAEARLREVEAERDALREQIQHQGAMDGLRAENATLQSALREIIALGEPRVHPNAKEARGYSMAITAACEIARRALAGSAETPPVQWRSPLRAAHCGDGDR